ncbi:MAG: glycosyltransferase family 2 protein [Candidatus Obscuribacterales bacterium]|nr:glycosyltransferase family 2 protein [Steroidobacteraceae bacterium]
MITVLSILAAGLAIPALFASSYLLGLTLLSIASRVPQLSSRKLRFDVIVPAHNEATLIAKVVTNLLRIDWPRENFRVVVVADNCNDATASLARAAGAEVLERQHDTLRGKGYALEYAFRASQQLARADAVVVIDADSEVSTNLLAACAARIQSGAHAVQVHYGVLDPHSSWRTRLMCIAMTAFHKLRSRGRERLRLSCGLRGNGWCVTHALLQRVPYQSFSLAEDIEYGIELGLAGYRVHYADEAYVDAEMVSDTQAAATQRRRWEHGRLQLISSKTLVLLKAAYRQRNAVCLDLALDLMVLPLSYVALNVAALTACAVLLAVGGAYQWLWPSALCVAALLLYVLRGWQLSGMGAIGLFDLARAPFFVLWKVILMLKPRESEWIRTKRRAQ